MHGGNSEGEPSPCQKYQFSFSILAWQVSSSPANQQAVWRLGCCRHVAARVTSSALIMFLRKKDHHRYLLDRVMDPPVSSRNAFATLENSQSLHRSSMVVRVIHDSISHLRDGIYSAMAAAGCTCTALLRTTGTGFRSVCASPSSFRAGRTTCGEAYS